MYLKSFVNVVIHMAFFVMYKGFKRSMLFCFGGQMLLESYIATKVKFMC
jgi:hypothetical protein